MWCMRVRRRGGALDACGCCSKGNVVERMVRVELYGWSGCNRWRKLFIHSVGGEVARLAFALALALIAVLFVCPCARLISSHLTPHECCSHPYSHIMIPFLVSWSISSVLHMNPMRNT